MVPATRGIQTAMPGWGTKTRVMSANQAAPKMKALIPMSHGLVGIDLAGVAVSAQEPRQTYERGDGGEANQDQGDWLVIGNCMESRTRLLCPAIPGETGADQECDACGDEAALAKPRLIATFGEDEFSDLHWDEDHPHAFESEHEE
jgi:hypothetical protein